MSPGRENVHLERCNYVKTTHTALRGERNGAGYERDIYAVAVRALRFTRAAADFLTIFKNTYTNYGRLLNVCRTTPSSASWTRNPRPLGAPGPPSRRHAKIGGGDQKVGYTMTECECGNYHRVTHAPEVSTAASTKWIRTELGNVFPQNWPRSATREWESSHLGNWGLVMSEYAKMVSDEFWGNPGNFVQTEARGTSAPWKLTLFWFNQRKRLRKHVSQKTENWF